MKKRGVAILGSTGSIGRQALDVLRQHPDLFSLELIVANNSADLLIEQALEFDANNVVICNESLYAKVAEALQPRMIKVFAGMQSVCDLVGSSDIDIVLTSMVGFSGLRSTVAAIEAGKTIALANKETLVAAGELVMRLAAEHNVQILPVDSEHSAIFQCLMGSAGNEIAKLHLTASGGPFRTWEKSRIADAVASDALKHPNWEMGAKITVDSASMMNKGLELIEAVWLFSVRPCDIDIVVHRESIVHSAVEYTDNSVIAQLGLPDMRIPIQYALTYPERYESPVGELSLSALGKLTFFEPDYDTFRCINLCREAINKGGLFPAAVNSANEQANAMFRSGEIGFLEIADRVERVLETAPQKTDYTLGDILEVDRWAREAVLSA